MTQRGTSSNATSYQYDDGGNLVLRTEPGNKATQFSYDSENRLTEAKDGSGNPIARYGYDPLDRRIWKEQFRNSDGSALTQAIRTTYLYANEGLIAEANQNITLNADLTVTAVGAVAITAQYGPNPDSLFTTGTLFVKTKNSNGVDSFAYFHLNHLGTPIQATDKQGNVVWASNYDAFGHASITTPSATAAVPTITSNLRLPGQYEDQETGLHYNFRRYYDPSTGRYIQRDPIGMRGGVNSYVYADANSQRYIDPTGLEIDYANHVVAPGFNHSKLIITPENPALYIDDPRFQNIDSEGRHFATIGAGPDSKDHLEFGLNRPRDVSASNAVRMKLALPCQYSNEDEAINNLLKLSNTYNKNKVWYTLLPRRIFGVPTGFNSNSFISGLGAAAGFALPDPENTGAYTPGYQNPVPSDRFFGH